MAIIDDTWDFEPTGGDTLHQNSINSNPFTEMDVEASFGDVVSASYDVYSNEDQWFSQHNLWSEKGFGFEQQNSVLDTMCELKGGIYCSDITRRGKRRDANFFDFTNNVEDVELYEEYALTNPDAVSISNTKAELAEDSKVRHENLSKVLARDSQTWSRIGGSFFGAAGAFLTDPVQLATMLIPGLNLAKGAQLGIRLANIGRNVSILSGTYATELVIQKQIEKTKNSLGMEHDPFLDAAIATSAVVAFPLLGRLVSKAWKSSKGAWKAGKADTRVVDANADKLMNKTNDDMMETFRDGVEFNTRGYINGAKISIDSGSDIDISFLGKKSQGVVANSGAEAMISTMHRAMGSKITKAVMNDMAKSGRLLSDITPAHLSVMRDQGSKANFGEADKFIKQYNAKVSNQPIASVEALQANGKILKSQIDRVDLADEMFDDVVSVADDGTNITKRNIIEDTDAQIENVRNAVLCGFTGGR